MDTKEMKSISHCLKESNVWNVTLKCVVLSASALECFILMSTQVLCEQTHPPVKGLYVTPVDGDDNWSEMWKDLLLHPHPHPHTHTHSYSS